jgi:hypothetical protein
MRGRADDDRGVPAVSRRDLVLGIPVSLLGGVVVGTIGTFKHQVGVSAATGAGWPVGLVLSLAMVAVFLVALRLGFPSRWFAAAAAAGIVAAVALLSLPGASGGSTVILLNTVGVVWTVAPAVVGAVVVALPRLGPRPRADADGILDADEDRRRTTE